MSEKGRRTSYYESTIRCARCENTLIVCGDNLLSQESNHAACVEACGWCWILSDDEIGVLCPECGGEAE